MNKRRPGIADRALMFVQLGFELAIGAAIGFFLGDWLDHKLGTLPILSLLGVVLVETAVMVKLYRQLTQLENDDAGHDRESDHSD